MRVDLGCYKFPRNKTEFEINGEIIEYDACSSNYYLQDAIKSYHAFDYIASSYIYYVNGIKNESQNLHHFFKYKSPENIKLIRKLKLKNIKTI